ncbi:hypothetical protein [Thalassospira xiamenensis]|nr:hypothetical protein [Thalassospira xiamenensis]
MTARWPQPFDHAAQFDRKSFMKTERQHSMLPQDIDKYAFSVTQSIDRELFPAFLKKVLDLFFWLWHKDKVNRTNGSGDKTRKA